ncbi:hypothetical protein MCOR27_004574 [Pyricularia oryzae]|uniref:Glucose receptor Git3-like N-terminal domain-containing protein n=3 Tax=Pyricularia TaxID=48558 RepID=A0ABQ8NIB1_PYRGI|nr:uncharacterized protein MGG_00258 [Pyricularia oryzae 70-15]KAH8841212.1 hypothetical protein MCOR01_007882 [Pyricularia oryzae]KAI6297003.1 hypothetical protein MCOR33_006545 [Pyricularia grisea]EHA49263.1 hypothetical protein MGG_00258 [Pyricularia oryzae 70-15]KAH9433457.1 hypothetical protein MCOR02_005505 [Pyricularia oryzae]KAI6256649.1 hypothetical protein MCOR19_006894 [Pyricularia oryzae]
MSTYESEIRAATLAGSLLSCLATSAVLVSFVAYRKEQRTFRHVLILNLTLSEFINSLNNSISGIISIRDTEIEPGVACTVNGFVGQLSVQAADFSILAIAIVTLLTVTRRAFLPAASTGKKIFLAMSIWIVPLFTSIYATAQGAMAPVAGNWCWITASRPDLRYALTHGWRILIIFGTIIIYAYIWWYMSRHFHSMVQIQRTGLTEDSTVASSLGTTSSGGTMLSTGNSTTVGVSSTKSLMVQSPPPQGKKKGVSWTRSIRSVRSARKHTAYDDDEEVQALPGGAALPEVKETMERELEFSDGGAQVPAIRLEKPPSSRKGSRTSTHGFGLSYLREEDKDLLSPPAVRSANNQEEQEPVGPKQPSGVRKSGVVSWQLPDIPPSPKDSWRRNFRDFGVQGSPSRSPSRSPAPSPVPMRSLSPLFKSSRQEAAAARGGKMERSQSPRWEPPWRDNNNASPRPGRSLSLWPLSSPRSPWRDCARMASPFRQPQARQPVTLMTNASEFPMRRQTRQVEKEIKRMMLLNAYPIFYVLLSIPGLVNRLLEATGIHLPSHTSQALQAPVQFIGLANALTYGFNKHVRHRIRGDWRALRGRAPQPN